MPVQNSESLLARLGLNVPMMFRLLQKEDNAGAWLYICDTNECWWSDQVYRIYGLAKNIPLTDNFFLDQVIDEDKGIARAAYAAALAGKPYHFVHRIDINGKIRYLEQRGRLFSGEKHPVPFILGTVRDVTAFKRQEARLALKRADFAAITQYLGETTDTTNISSIVSSVKRTIRRRMDVVIIAVFVRQGETISRVIPDKMDPTQAFLFQELQEFVGYHAVISGRRQVIPVEQYPSSLGGRALREMGGQSVEALPIKHDGLTIGALSIVMRHARGLNRHEREFCRTICGYLSNQLNNALLYDRLKQELQLRKRFETDRDVIFNESVDFISIIGRDGRFCQINPAFAARLGFSQESLVDRSVFDFIHPEDRVYAQQVYDTLPLTGVIRGFHNRFLCGGGEIGHFESSLKYMDETGATIAIARDLTGQKEMEERNTLLAQRVAFEQTKSEFFTGLSHEFKTPLNIILSSVNLIRLKSTQEDAARFEREYAKFFDYIDQNCYRLLRLTTNLLDAGRLESGYFCLNVAKIRLDELAVSIVGAAEAYAAANKTSLRLYMETQRAPILACDEDGVERILLNLLSNAIKNSREGGRIIVTIREDADFFTVMVDDNGVGIPPEMLPNIFDKFITTRNPISGLREGSGIGLSLVKRLTELHGGMVLAESQLGVGSRFTFTLSKKLTPTGDGEHTAGAVRVLAQRELSDMKLKLR